MYSPLRLRSNTERESAPDTYRPKYSEAKEDYTKVANPVENEKNINEMLMETIHRLENENKELANELRFTKNMMKKEVLADTARLPSRKSNISVRTSASRIKSRPNQDISKEENKTKIIYTLQQDTASLNNKLNKKRLKMKNLKSELMTIKKEASLKVKQLEKSITNLIVNASEYKDKSSSFDRLLREKDILELQNSKQVKEIGAIKNENQYNKIKINELLDQVNFYKAQLEIAQSNQNQNDSMPLKEVEEKLKAILDKAYEIPSFKETVTIETGNINTEIEAIGSIMDYLIKMKEYNEQKYNKLLALHEMIVDNEGKGINPSIYKIMDENEGLRKKLMQMQSTNSIEEIGKQELNAQDKQELNTKVELLEMKLKAMEDKKQVEPKKKLKKSKIHKNLVRHSYQEDQL